jgi:hypothetical protein
MLTFSRVGVYEPNVGIDDLQDHNQGAASGPRYTGGTKIFMIILKILGLDGPDS